MKEIKRKRMSQIIVCIFTVLCMCMLNVSAEEITKQNIEIYDVEENVVQTGFQEINHNIYMIMPDGSKYTGWFSVEGKTFFFDKDGIMQRGDKVIDGRLYHFQDTGELRTGWVNQETGKYYYSKCGIPYTGLKTINNENYYFLEDGKLAVNQVVGMYMADEQGRLVRMPYTLENLDAALDEILLETGNDITKIGKYVKGKLKYKYIDKMATREEMAVYALSNRRCSCYYYEALCGLLLERAGYEVITVQGKGRVYAEHYWSLVKTTRNGVEGWYHVDALNEKYVVTDKELVASGQVWNHANYPATP